MVRSTPLGRPTPDELASSAIRTSSQKEAAQRGRLQGVDTIMKSPISEMFGIEFPLLAFSHCRAGGFGVLIPENISTASRRMAASSMVKR